MAPRTRLFVALALTVIVLGGLIVFFLLRLHHAKRDGAAGFSYIEVSGQGGQKQFMGLGPGDVMMAYPGAAADRAGIGRGDRIVSINGIPITDVARLRELDRQVRTGDQVTYELERDGTRKRVVVAFEPLFRTIWSRIYLIVNALVASVFAAIGLLVVTRRPDDHRVMVFYAMVIVGALSISGSMLLAIDNSSLRGIVVSPTDALLPMAVIGVFVIAFMPLTLHLSLVFPHDRRILREHPQVLRWVYGVPVIAMLFAGAAMVLATLATRDSGSASGFDSGFKIAFTAGALIGIVCGIRLLLKARAEGWLPALIRRPGHVLLFLFGILVGIARLTAAFHLKIVTIIVVTLTILLPFIALASFPVFACIALYRSYREAGAEERRQVKWPLWGTLIALVTKIVLTVAMYAAMTFVMVTGRDFREWFLISQILQLVPVVVYLLIPISFAVAILKYRLMNIDVIIRKTVAYAILSGAIVFFYLVLVGGLGTLLVRFAGVQNQTMVIGATLVVGLLFVPLRNRLQSLVDRNLFPHRFSYPEALKAIATEARTATDFNWFLRSTAEKLQQALQNRSVVIFIERQEDFSAAAKIGVADSFLGTRVSGAIANHLERPFDPRRRPLETTDAALLTRMDAVLVVPIARQGFLALAPKLSGAAYDIEDIDFLTATTGELALALERTRMQGEEADLVQARAIQQRLIPQQMPQIPGLDVSGEWQPAKTMGGDYFDVLELGPTELALCIGDVAGKGMPAALLMSGLQAAVRSSASSSPRDLCERVRRVVVSSLSGGRFVTFFYATMDTADRRLRWCNAGHNPPVLARADGTVIRLDGGGPAISRLFRDPYGEHQIELRAGDRLVMFTDGVSEAAGSDGVQLGEDRLEAFVREAPPSSAEDLLKSVVDLAVRHAGGELDDDMTILVAAVTVLPETGTDPLANRPTH